MPKGFRIGNHEFLEPGAEAPLSRTSAKRRSPISRAEPPPFLAGFTREPATSLASKVLVQGTFCGHGEPTYTVFDIVINGQDRLDVVTFFAGDEEDDDDPEAEGQDAVLVLARPCGTKGDWLVVFSEEWRDESGDIHVPDEPELHAFDEEEEDEVAETAQAALLSIGFEYPPDADSLKEFSWLALDAWPDDHEDEPYVLVSTETR